MFDILHHTFLRLGDPHRFGPPHLRQIVRKMAVQIATEKSRGNTTVTVPVHPEFAESLRAARGRDRPRRGVHREVREGPRITDEQKGLGGEVQEVCRPGWRQRIQEKLPWRAKGPRRSGSTPIAPRARWWRCLAGPTKMPAHYTARANRDRDRYRISRCQNSEIADQSTSPTIRGGFAVMDQPLQC